MHRHRSHHCAPALETVRVILVYKDFRGRGFSHAGLGVSSISTAKVLRRAGIWADVWASMDAKDLRRRVELSLAQSGLRNEVPISHIVIAAPWIDPATLAQLATDFPEIVWTVVCHSGVGFLAADPEAIRFMRETAELQHLTYNIRAAGNSEAFVRWASETWKTHFTLLRNLYDTSECSPPSRKPWGGEILRLGMFGAARALKNGVSGAAAAAQLAVRLRVPVELQLSSGRDEGGSLRPIEEITKGIPNLTVRRMGWLSWPQFRSILRHIHVHLQPSFTESFNMTVADAIAEHVPSVVGPAVEWCPAHWKADVDDPSDIARVAEALLYDTNAAEDGRRALERYVREALPDWLHLLGASAGTIEERFHAHA
jgi:hypothetical protein